MGKRNLYSTIFLLCLFLLPCIVSSGQAGINKKTFIYSIKDKDTLRLDVYSDPEADTANRPCFLYVFGGGFVVGERDDKVGVSFFEKIVKKGFNVVAIDYRLGLRKAFGDPEDKTAFMANLEKYKPKEFLNVFYGSIDMAVEDLFDATTFVVQHAGQMHINPNQIIPIGSSAGAITVLQGQYYISNNAGLATKHLPDNFSYAGVVSMAGAVFSIKGNIKWNKRPPPILMFHGDADQQVPYSKTRIKILMFPLKYGFYGSKYIAGQLSKGNSPFWFYSVEDAGHEMCYKPLSENLNEILSFYDKYIVQQQRLSITTTIKDYGVPTKKKKFGFADYLKGNFGG